jgi:hypothetical protein
MCPPALDTRFADCMRRKMEKDRGLFLGRSAAYGNAIALFLLVHRLFDRNWRVNNSQ